MSLFARLLICGFALTLSENSRLVATPLNDLIPRADVIVVGAVKKRVESPTHISFDIHVEQILKGNSGKSIHISQEWPRKGVVFPAVATVEFTAHGIWFLRATSSSEWEALQTGGPPGIFPNLYYPVAERPLSERYQYSVDAPLMDKLILELAAAQSKSSFLDAVWGMDSPAIRRVFTEDMNSADREIQCTGLVGLIARGQDGVIGELVQRWPVLKREPSARLILAALRNDFVDQSPESIRQLAVIAADRSAEVDLRGAAAQALVNVHNKEALPFLASFLESTSSVERMKAAFGFWSFANGCPSWPGGVLTNGDYLARCVNPSVYKTKETIVAFGWPPGPADSAKTVAYWRTWWKAHPDLH